MKNTLLLLCTLTGLAAASSRLHADEDKPLLRINADELEDKIRGGMLAQIIGNLNGLPHEFKYIDEPGNVVDYTPGLPDGAFTDDDTDVEWVYLREIARSRHSRLPPERLAALWKAHINRRIFASNHYARQLMDLGLEPPWTGNAALNPWAEFNISGQFLCESFGLMAPAMPQTAARTGLNYTHVAIDGEPAQTTQLFTTMIATAFTETNLDRILDAGMAAVDPRSEVLQVVRQTRDICRTHPDDWRLTRAEIKKRWQVHNGEMRDRNGYELNGAATVAALVYGRKDFVETLRLAFNFGWDCDNNAATAATIIGVMKGRRWMNEQGWKIANVYRNTTRDDMPMDETLTSLEDTLIECARVVIAEQGGDLATENGQRVYRIRTEAPGNVEPLSKPAEQLARARETLSPRLESGLAGSPTDRARAAYVALCLGEATRLQRESPEKWAAAVRELEKFPVVVRNLYRSPLPGGEPLQRQAREAGVKQVK